ncbi:MAG: hypothetical protein AAGF47_04420 [Planctomycetota bacterium]
MIASHPCTGCGLDVRTVAAPPDPHYGLPVVVCPRCGAASVRRRSRLRPRDAVLRRVRVVSGLVWRGSMLLLLGIISLVPLAVAMNTAGDERASEPVSLLIVEARERLAEERDLMPLLLPVAAVSTMLVAAGVLVRVLLRHWRLWALPLAASVWIGLVWAAIILNTNDARALRGDPVAGLSTLAITIALIWLGAALTHGALPGPMHRHARQLRRARKQQRRRLQRTANG